MIGSAFPLARPGRAAALALLLAAFAGTAYANDEYGTDHDTVISQAAASSGYGERASIASAARVASVPSDVVGTNGPQDMLARQIYHPGSGTDW
jgi:hypothetical protein